MSDETEIPNLTLFTTDKKHMDIIEYMMAIDNFMYTKMNPFNTCMTKRLLLDKNNIVPNETNQCIFNRKWNDTQRNFDEASCKTKYRRDLEYNDKLILTLFYVLYNIELFDDYDINLLEHGIYSFSNVVSLEHNHMGQTYMSLYKQLQHCCIRKDNKIIISDDKSKEYFIL
jgi:hypothetical protein